MPRDFSRSRRIADLIQRELAVLVQRELDRQHAGLVTISSVSVSPDLSQATAWFTSIGAAAQPAELAKELNDMAGKFRHALAQALSLRSMPRLRFEFDASVERGSRLASLIDSLQAKPPADD